MCRWELLAPGGMPYRGRTSAEKVRGALVIVVLCGGRVGIHQAMGMTRGKIQYTESSSSSKQQQRENCSSAARGVSETRPYSMVWVRWMCADAVGVCGSASEEKGRRQREVKQTNEKRFFAKRLVCFKSVLRQQGMIGASNVNVTTLTN